MLKARRTNEINRHNGRTGDEGSRNYVSPHADASVEVGCQSFFDKWAVKVFAHNDTRIGYLPCDINEIPARLMDAGKHLLAKIENLEVVGTWNTTCV